MTGGAAAPVALVATEASAVKPQLAGLVDRKGLASPEHRPVVNGFVIDVDWADLQLQPGGPIASENTIDRAVAEIRRLNAGGPDGELGVKLRVYAGGRAPEWAKRLDGPPMSICGEPETSGPDLCVTVGRFWTARFRDAYDDLQTKLAARYDGMPEIREVAISRCTTLFAEPFLRQTRHDTNLRQYWGAGFTTAADRRCHREQIDSHRVWGRTRSGLASNPYQEIDVTGWSQTTRVDVAFTQEMVGYCAEVLGERCVLGNNSIRSKWLGPDYEEMFDVMRASGQPLYFQTAQLSLVGDLAATVEWAIGQGAGMVELPAGYADVLSPSAMTAFDEHLTRAAMPRPVPRVDPAPAPAPGPSPPPAEPVVAPPTTASPSRAKQPAPVRRHPAPPPATMPITMAESPAPTVPMPPVTPAQPAVTAPATTAVVVPTTPAVILDVGGDSLAAEPRSSAASDRGMAGTSAVALVTAVAAALTHVHSGRPSSLNRDARSQRRKWRRS